MKSFFDEIMKKILELFFAIELSEIGIMSREKIEKLFEKTIEPLFVGICFLSLIHI